jgi:hypothetical protein
MELKCLTIRGFTLDRGAGFRNQKMTPEKTSSQRILLFSQPSFEAPDHPPHPVTLSTPGGKRVAGLEVDFLWTGSSAGALKTGLKPEA